MVGNQLQCKMLHCNNLLNRQRYRTRAFERPMSQQLTISSLFAALALVTLAMFARAGELAAQNDAAGALVSYQEQTISEV